MTYSIDMSVKPDVAAFFDKDTKTINYVEGSGFEVLCRL